MRYGIFSDVHSNLEALDEVIGAFSLESIDEYLCIGDIVGYAANPCECIEKVRGLAKITVAGNHDWAAVNLFSQEYFNDYAKEALVWTRLNIGDAERDFLRSLKLTYANRCLSLVHGTLDGPGEFNYMTDGFMAQGTFRLLKTNLCFIGHTHRPGIFMEDKAGQMYYLQESSCRISEENKYIVNVGSVGQPRDANPRASFCIYDTQRQTVEIKRIDYDRELTRKKIIAGGLPRFEADRLLAGR